MHIINRSIAILKAKQTYVDWINALPGPTSNMTLKKLAQDQNSYLIPSYDTVDQSMEFVLKNAKRILEAEFTDWDTSDLQGNSLDGPKPERPPQVISGPKAGRPTQALRVIQTIVKEDLS